MHIEVLYNADTGGASAATSEAPAASAPAPAATPAVPETPAAAPTDNWFDKLHPDMKTWASAKGLTAETPPNVLLESQYHLEKMTGRQAAETIPLPKDETDVDGYEKIYDRLGRPKTAAEYAMEFPEGADEKITTTLKEGFHKLGFSDKQAAGALGIHQALVAEQQAEAQRNFDREMAALETEWGKDFDHKQEIARAAIRAAGISDEDAKAFEKVYGPLKSAKMFEFFGRNYLEAQPPGQENRLQTGFNAMTPARAQERIAQLRGDALFMARYENPDPKIRADAMKEMDDLHRVAQRMKIG